jgi:hypothetical protein
MFYLEIQSVRTTSQLRSAANANELDSDGYRVDGDYVIVETQAEANKLLNEYSNLDLDLDAGAEQERDEVDTEDDYQCGVNDCSREVADPNGTCWQHDED